MRSFHRLYFKTEFFRFNIRIILLLFIDTAKVVSFPEEVEDQQGQIADSRSNGHDVPIILGEFIFDIIAIGGFDEIGGEGGGISLHTCSQPVNVYCDWLDKYEDKEKPGHPSGKFNIEVNSQSELLQFVCIFKCVQFFLS